MPEVNGSEPEPDLQTDVGQSESVFQVARQVECVVTGGGKMCKGWKGKIAILQRLFCGGGAMAV